LIVVIVVVVVVVVLEGGLLTLQPFYLGINDLATVNNASDQAHASYIKSRFWFLFYDGFI
jgi:hypothetical protein